MDLRDKILKVTGGTKLTAVATIAEESGQMLPAVRYMWATGAEDLTLSAFTRNDSRKVSQIEKNPNVSLMIAEDGDPTKPYVAIRATAEVHRDTDTKRLFWGPHLVKLIKDPEDPKYVAIRFVPTRIEYYSGGQMDVWPRGLDK